MNGTAMASGTDGYITTFSGARVYPWDMTKNVGKITVRDIAAALSNECRFAGHCTALNPRGLVQRKPEFYSVANHSINVQRAFDAYVTETNPAEYPGLADDDEKLRRISLYCLLHEVEEAFGFRDLPPAMKMHSLMSGYLAASVRCRNWILQSMFDFTDDEIREFHPIMKRFDLSVLKAEKARFMSQATEEWSFPADVIDGVNLVTFATTYRPYSQLVEDIKWYSEGRVE